ncbi:DUF3099 domain-containing protein [Tessaracoccus sp. HDW20]|nr:DUF3099 domain-containing protein [Tessaracoccus coleopterorum]
MARNSDATLITNAGHSQSLALAERQKRYLITMGVRTGCFLAFLVVPGWWKLVALGRRRCCPHSRCCSPTTRTIGRPLRCPGTNRRRRSRSRRARWCRAPLRRSPTSESPGEAVDRDGRVRRCPRRDVHPTGRVAVATPG